MAKKSRRTRKQTTDIQPQQASRPAPIPTSVAVEEPDTSPILATPQKSFDFSEEYYYVYTDLRNVTIVAVIMFGLMVGLGYLVPQLL